MALREVNKTLYTCLQDLLSNPTIFLSVMRSHATSQLKAKREESLRDLLGSLLDWTHPFRLVFWGQVVTREVLSGSTGKCH